MDFQTSFVSQPCYDTMCVSRRTHELETSVKVMDGTVHNAGLRLVLGFFKEDHDGFLKVLLAHFLRVAHIIHAIHCHREPAAWMIG